MGVSTDGILCYGFLLPEETELPWECEEHDHDIEAWWNFEVHEWPDPPFRPYTEEGEYAEGVADGDPRIDTYYAEQSAYVETVPPCPIELENACHHEHPVWIASIPGVGLTASRGHPQRVDTRELVATEEQVQAAREFLAEYLPGVEIPEPDLWLGSYWG